MQDIYLSPHYDDIAFSMNLWKKAVKNFGGIPPISMAEDVLFFTQCKNFL